MAWVAAHLARSVRMQSTRRESELDSSAFQTWLSFDENVLAEHDADLWPGGRSQDDRKKDSWAIETQHAASQPAVGQALYGLRYQWIVFLVVLVRLLTKAGIHILAAVFGILSRFGKIRVAPLNTGIFGAVRKLSLERCLAVLVAIFALDRALLEIVILVGHE